VIMKKIYVISTVAGGQKVGEQILTVASRPIEVALTRDIQRRLERGQLRQVTSLTAPKILNRAREEVSPTNGDS